MPDGSQISPESVSNRLSSAYGETNIGLKRDNNEDAVLNYDSKLMGKRYLMRVFAVADGVGGSDCGEVASKSIIHQIFEHISEKERPVSERDLRSIDMRIPRGATTLVLAQAINDGNLFRIFSIGDSSALLLDTHKKTLSEITVRDENESGEVTQALGPEGRVAAAAFNKPNTVDIHLKDGQTLILATDGFTRYLDKGKIRPIDVLMARLYYKNNVKFTRELIRMANTCGGSDNITVVSIPYEKTSGS